MGPKIKVIAIIFLMWMVNGTAVAQVYPASFTVAQDGTGNYKTIQEAVNAVRDFSMQQVTIHIKNGVYDEKLVIPAWKTSVFLSGEDKNHTIIKHGDYLGKDGINTFTSYTVMVRGNDFRAENLTIENSAGPVGQAVALHVEADRVVVQDCRLLGNQDTLFPATDSSRQYYRNCYIEGTTDFIFGRATAVFDHCVIHSKRNSYITAAATAERQQYGFVFFDCKLTAAEGIDKVYLGRPWRPHARTVFINTDMGAHILPAGWRVWNENDNHKTSFYAEYGSYGPGFVKEARVDWSKQLSKKEVKQYTIAQIFSGINPWQPK